MIEHYKSRILKEVKKELSKKNNLSDFNFEEPFKHFDSLDKIASRSYINDYLKSYIEGTNLYLQL